MRSWNTIQRVRRNPRPGSRTFSNITNDKYLSTLLVNCFISIVLRATETYCFHDLVIPS